MEFVFDYNEFVQYSKNPITAAWWLFKNGGWVFLFSLAFYLGAYMWLAWRRSVYDKTREFMSLAIDVPKNNEQSPKAVEQMITHLSGAHDGPKREDKWVTGRTEEAISLEIVSLGGYIQYVIHAHKKFRDLIEAAIYSQYPDAEITEIEDYTKPFHGLKFPNDTYQMWSCEQTLMNKQYYPLRTYPQFEHPLSGEFKDPLSAMLEMMSKLGPDEQLWFQIVIFNTDVSWKDEGHALVKKLIGSRLGKEPKKTLADRIIDAPLKGLGILGDVAIPFGIEEEAGQVYEPPSLMQHISPGERAAVEAIEIKLSKVGFYTRIRWVYIAKYDMYRGVRVDEMFGAIKQFNTLDLNALKPHKWKVTKVYGLFKKFRKNYRNKRLLAQYITRGRAYTPGYFGHILNSEELATIYHFPVMTVKAPLVKKTQARKAEPPMSLPIE